MEILIKIKNNMKSGDFTYDMKKNKTKPKKKIIIMYSVDLVLQHSPWRNWEGKKCEDMHVCLNLDFLNLKFVLETKDNCVGSQIILSTILSIPNTNYTRILVFMWETIFPWKAKPWDKLWINSLLSSQLQLIYIYI